MIALATPIRKSVERLSQLPVAFDWLRWILEGGFINHRRLIARNFPSPPKRVLDCGCGTGIYASSFPSESYTGIDLSPKYIERARRCYPEYRFKVMDATALNFANESFDAVIVSGVIHHLPNIDSQRLLSEVWRVLRPGGQLLLWEDVPTRSRLNIIGQLVHQLDVGEHIREGDAYVELLLPLFDVECMAAMRSGFMDYITLSARKPTSQPICTHQPAPWLSHQMEFTPQLNLVSPTE